MIGQKNGISVSSQQLSPTLKRFRVVPQTMGNHRQSTEFVARGLNTGSRNSCGRWSTERRRSSRLQPPRNSSLKAEVTDAASVACTKATPYSKLVFKRFAASATLERSIDAAPQASTSESQEHWANQCFQPKQEHPQTCGYWNLGQSPPAPQVQLPPIGLVPAKAG